jgi:hypothetical protein
MTVSVAWFSPAANEECHAAKGKPTCRCFWAQLKIVNFFILAVKNVTINSI